MCYFCECVLQVCKYVCIVYALSSYFEGLRGSAERSRKWQKMGLQTTSAPVTDMRPSGCSVEWTVIDCTDPGLCMRRAVNVSITAGKASRKDRCENKLFVLAEKNKVNIALNWGYNPTDTLDANFWGWNN